MSQYTKPDDWKHLKRFGYAPGNYLSHCCRCGHVLPDLDKRATTCKPCAEAMHTADTIDALRAEVERLRKDAERWQRALSAYRRGVIQGFDGNTGKHDGYVSEFLAAIREDDAAMKDPK